MTTRLGPILAAVSMASMSVAVAVGAVAVPATPALGAVDPMMLRVEQQLAALHYDVGPVDGVFDEQTSSAVMAFQKVLGIERTGQLTHPLAAAIVGWTVDPPPLVPGGGPDRIEIDTTRQVLFLYQYDQLFRIIPVSTGTAETPTPKGAFRIYRRATGWETSHLGRLYNSQYFVGGYAIHGSLSVPPWPASHGCVRLPMTAAEWFPSYVSYGTPVYVMGV